MTTKYAPYTSTAAANRAEAKVGHSNEVGMCAREVIRGIFGLLGPYKWGGGGQAWAINYFKGAQKVVKTSDPMKIPRGAMVFWDARPGATTTTGRAGHVAVGAGNGYCYSTDLPTSGRWGKIKISDVQKLWGKPLVGYVIIDGMGFTLTDPPVAPPVAVWGKPDTWQIGSTGPDVVRLGERVQVWSEYYGLPDPYTFGPGSPFTEVDRAGLSKVQQKFFPKAQTTKGGGADGYPGTETFTRLAADPPSLPPAQPKTTQVLTADMNFAGNNATGIRTAGTRIPKYVAARKAKPVHVITAQECTVASTVRPRLDSGLKPLGYLRSGGGKGRYDYVRGVKVIASGLITVPSKHWYQRDDKQAAWTIYDLDGIRGMDVSYHLESDSGSVPDELRPLQMLDILSAALHEASMYDCDKRNIGLFGDSNSENSVVKAMKEAGWRNIAAGSEYEDEHTFMGWDGKSRKRFDYGFVHKEAGPAQVESLVHDTGLSDHASIRFRRILIGK